MPYLASWQSLALAWPWASWASDINKYSLSLTLTGLISDGKVSAVVGTWQYGASPSDTTDSLSHGPQPWHRPHSTAERQLLSDITGIHGI